MADKRPDSELVAATLAGNREAFGELVARYKDAVFGVAFHRLGNFEEARDAAQEAFIKAYLRLPALRSRDRFAQWLCRIADGTATDFARRRKRDVPLEAAEGIIAAGPPSRNDAIACEVSDALRTLSEPTRLAVILHYVNGYSYAEVADFLGISPGAVKTRLSRVRTRLRKEMTAMVSDGLHRGAPAPDFAELTLEQLRGKAHGLFRGSAREQKDYQLAYQAYISLRSRESDAERAANSQMMAGICLLNLRRYKQAVAAFWEAIHSYRDQVDAPLLAYLAMTYYEARDYEKALACWSIILAHLSHEPYHWAIEEACLGTGRCLEKLGLSLLANKAYRNYLALYPEGCKVAEARAGSERTEAGATCPVPGMKPT